MIETTGVESEGLEAFLARLASASPTPGGGAAAALTGALAAALVAMVSRVTARRDPTPDVTEAAAAADELCHRVTRLATDDAEAYERVLEARRLPLEARKDGVRSALTHATEVPLELVRCSRELLALCEIVAPHARASALGDLAVAVSLAWAALESGAGTARVNLKELEDPQFVTATGGELNRLVAEGQTLRHRVLEVVRERLGISREARGRPRSHGRRASRGGPA